MAQWDKALTSQPEDGSSIPGAQVEVEGENHLHRVVLGHARMACPLHIRHVHNNNEKQSFL